MSWDFYIIMVNIVGAPSNDAESFILYMLACGLGSFIVLFVFELFRMVGNFSQRRG